MKNILIIINIFLLQISAVFPTEYFVNNEHFLTSDTNPGTNELPLQTIQVGVNKANQAGDIVYVHSGTYDEQVTCRYSGNAGDGFINIVGYPGEAKPVMRGFTLSGKSYIRIIGFEITHNSTAFSHGITPGNNCSHIDILDNYIHHIVGQGVRWYNHNNTFITVRGNDIYMAACPANTPGECIGNGSAVGMSGGGNILIEYNNAHRVGDFINIGTDTVIVRNNYLYDFKNSYWTDGPGDGLHCDMFQPCGAELFPSQYHVYESNFMGDNVESNSHILQMRTDNSDDHNIIFRGNVGYNHGSYSMQCGGVDNVYYYNNTIHDIMTVSPGNSGIGYNSEGNDNALNNQNFNNIFSEFGNGLKPTIVIETGCTLESSNNLCYEAGSHSSCVSSENPMFQNVVERDFELQANSPAIGIGKSITTITSATSSGTSFDVQNAELFCDGFGFTDGDLIKIGNNEPVRISKINANTITINKEISWMQNDGVFWRNQDSSPDLGAYEYNASGYGIDFKIISPNDNDNLKGQVSIAVESQKPENIRFVIFYIDGIPVEQDFESPYSFELNTDLLATDRVHFIEARAYPLYASKILSISDTVRFTVGQTYVSDLAGKENEIIIIPNPTTGKCLIKLNCEFPETGKEITLRIYNQSGIIVDELKSNTGQFNWENIEMQNGIYFLKVVGDFNCRSEKLVLIR